MTTPTTEQSPEPIPQHAIIVSGDALHGLADTEIDAIRTEIEWMLRARLGRSAILVTAAQEIMPIEGTDTGNASVAAANTMRNMRTEAGLSQTELAAAVGSTQTAVSDIEKRGRLPRIDTVGRIAEATGHGVGMYVARRRSDEDRLQSLAARVVRGRA